MSSLDAIVSALPTTEDTACASAAVLHVKSLATSSKLSADDREALTTLLMYLGKTTAVNYEMSNFIIKHQDMFK